MANTRIGIVGANVERGSWGTRAHIPALQALADYELKAVCTAHRDTAEAAAKAFGAELAFDDCNAMFARPDIDLVAVVVRAPAHYDITMAALRAGKDVFCEWPLGTNLREAEEMAALAARQSVRTLVGLQARSDPTLMYLRELLAEGYLGRVISCDMAYVTAAALTRTPDRLWPADRRNGVSTLTIAGGHSIDALCFCLGEFQEVSARVVTQIRQWRVAGSDEIVNVDAPDSVVANGLLEGGVLASLRVASVPFNAAGWRLEIYGDQGTLLVSGASPAQAGKRLLGSRNGEPLAEMTVPDRFTLVPEGTPAGPPFNVAQAYARFAERGGHGAEAGLPDFDLALRRHRLLDAMERSSAEGRAVPFV